MLGANEFRLRRGFACGKTLVRRKGTAPRAGPRAKSVLKRFIRFKKRDTILYRVSLLRVPIVLPFAGIRSRIALVDQSYLADEGNFTFHAADGIDDADEPAQGAEQSANPPYNRDPGEDSGCQPDHQGLVQMEAGGGPVPHDKGDD